MADDDSIPGLPTWLRNSHNGEHITLVLGILANRERTRSVARSASRHQSHPSRAHRISHKIASLPTTSAKAEHVAHYAITVGSDTQNLGFNRYSDIYPYDRTRVIVCPGEPNHDCPSSCTSGRYLNANWVRELGGRQWWIATQAPLLDSIHCFLSVMLKGVSPPPGSGLPNLRKPSRVRTVVQLTLNTEKGMRKADTYFPHIVGQSFTHEPEPGCQDPPIRTTLISSIEEAHYVHSIVSLELMSASHRPLGRPIYFQHFLYGSWPDHGVPAQEDREGLLRFAQRVDEANRDVSLYSGEANLDPNPPIMVNCSAGVGRTGAFIALCSLLRRYRLLLPPPPAVKSSLLGSPLGALPKELNEDLVALEIDALREQRPGMVQRDDQVVMVYETLIAAFAMSPQPTSSRNK